MMIALCIMSIVVSIFSAYLSIKIYRDNAPEVKEEY